MSKHQKQQDWTEAETDRLLKLRLRNSSREIAQILGRSRKSIEQKLAKLREAGKIPKIPSRPKATPDEPLADFWRKEATDAKRKLAEATQKRTATDMLVERAVELAPTGYSPVPGKVFTRSVRHKGSPQSAVLMLSDTHIGQVIRPDQTLGLGGYNFEIFLRRLQRLEHSVFSILEDHTTTPIHEIVVAILGDMIHGNLEHAAEAGQVNTLFDQFYSAGHALAQFLRNLSRLAPVRIHTAVGNHPRWSSQKKMPTENRYSNLDHFLYAYLAALLRDVPTLTFNLNKQPSALFEVQGHQFFATHGDTFRGGDKILGVPNHAIGRNVSAVTQNFSAAGKVLPNYYLIGHLHRPISLPIAAGEFMVNGGFPGIDGFALAGAFNLSKPSQRFFLIHPKFGKAASYELRIDFGDNTPHGYSLPGEFSCK